MLLCVRILIIDDDMEHEKAPEFTTSGARIIIYGYQTTLRPLKSSRKPHPSLVCQIRE